VYHWLSPGASECKTLSVKVIIGAAGKGLTVTASDEAVPLPHELVPFTVTAPDRADVPKFTVMLFVLLVPDAPVGSVHIYDVALVITGTV